MNEYKKEREFILQLYYLLKDEPLSRVQALVNTIQTIKTLDVDLTDEQVFKIFLLAGYYGSSIKTNKKEYYMRCYDVIESKKE